MNDLLHGRTDWQQLECVYSETRGGIQYLCSYIITIVI